MAAAPALSRRLLLAAALWLLPVLAGGGWLLSASFEAAVLRHLDAGLIAQSDSLAALLSFDDTGHLTLGEDALPPAFSRPYSGSYWQIVLEGDVLRSASLWNDRLPALPPGLIWTEDARGRTMRRLDRQVFLPDATPVMVTLTLDAAETQAEIAAFRQLLWLSLGLAAVGLPLVLWGQVRWGLRPLRHLAQALADLRNGRRDRLPPGDVRELEPLVGEINSLLDHTATLLARARGGAADLAHAVKTPLAIMRGELAAPAPDRSLLDEQIRQIDGLLGRHLARAAAAGPTGGQRCQPAPLADELARGLARLHGAAFSVNLPPGLTLAIDRDDLLEILGALMDNAGRFARSRVNLTGREENGMAVLILEDDGPGMTADQRTAALTRGQRFDSAPGSGLGLTVADDLTRLYRGSLALETADIGGLRVVLRLPSAA